MGVKVTKKWANQIAAGTEPMIKRLNADIQAANITRMQDKEEPVPEIGGLSDLFREGQTFVEVLVLLGISRAQYYKACDMSARFKAEHDLGLVKSEAWWMSLGRAGAAGRTKIQPASWIWVTKNRFGWKEPKGEKQAPPDPLANTTITPEMTPVDAAKIYAAEILNNKK